MNTAVGVRVLGRKLDDVVRASEEIAAVVKRLPGAADVVADPVRGKAYLEIRIDRERAARLGVTVGEANEVVETALAARSPRRRWRDASGTRSGFATAATSARTRSGARPAGHRRADRNGSDGRSDRQVPLAEVADVQIVEGPATIKSENGLLRNYVRLNVRDRDAADFVEEARRSWPARSSCPKGSSSNGPASSSTRSARGETLTVDRAGRASLLIFLILYLTYHDLADAALDAA